MEVDLSWIVEMKCTVGGIGFVAVVEKSSISFAGYHATPGVVRNTVCFEAAVTALHKNYGRMRLHCLLVITGIHQYDVSCMNRFCNVSPAIVKRYWAVVSRALDSPAILPLFPLTWRLYQPKTLKE
ncbi:hypothetical protein PIB30_035616 [Stylosanthes scabra]|uniref:RNase H type-1 domain-containing protein n=1 Tax=Stylosanthes scabra TaxID=79078 RepID=A0ABU6YBZ0_9FABA|nr:hypothetical protein [Stylosanthes scabra]